MADTDLFREQHKRILKVADRLRARLEPHFLAGDAMETRLVVSELAGLLNVHLAMEDDSLYPSLRAHQDEVIRELAARYAEEMGGFSESFGEYVKKWTYSHLIQQDPQTFITETNEIMRALADRIAREDRELYPLVDQDVQ